MEWAHRGVRVNSISPGYTATPMNLRPEVAEQVTQFAADTPLGRMAAVDELVGPAIFLLSEAASFCTGVDLLVDGGFTCCKARGNRLSSISVAHSGSRARIAVSVRHERRVARWDCAPVLQNPLMVDGVDGDGRGGVNGDHRLVHRAGHRGR